MSAPRLPDGLYNIDEGHEPQPVGRVIGVDFGNGPAVTVNFTRGKNSDIAIIDDLIDGRPVVDLRAVLCDVIAAWAEGNAPQFGGKFVSMTNGLVRDMRERDVNDLILVAQNYRETHGEK